MKARRHRIARILLGAQTAGILILTCVPGEATPPPPFSAADKLVHWGLFAAWGFLWCAASGRPARKGAIFARAAAAVGIAAFFGAVTEGLQAFVPARSPDLLDLAADTAGGGTGALLWWLWERTRRAGGASSRSQAS